MQGGPSKKCCESGIYFKSGSGYDLTERFCADLITAATQGVTKRCRLSWLTNNAIVYEPKCRKGVAGEAVSTAVHMEPMNYQRKLTIKFYHKIFKFFTLSLKKRAGIRSIFNYPDTIDRILICVRIVILLSLFVYKTI